MVTEQIADSILDNIDPKFVVNVLWKYAGAMHEYGVNDLKWLSEGETEHYAIKILYGISDIRQLREFLLALKSLVTNSVSCEAQKDVVRTVIKTLNSIIDESTSEEIEVDKDNNTHEMFRYLNDKDFTFTDIRMSDLLITNNNDVEKVSSIIESLSKDKFVRIIVDRDLDAVYTNLLKKISIDNDSVSVKFKKQEIEKRVPDEYNFLLDTKISYDDKITKFIKIKQASIKIRFNF
jgi:hypothetical protein